MVIKVNRTKYMRQVLNYNEKKVASGDAKILFAAGFPRDPMSMSLKNKIDIFTKLTRQNQRTKANTLHISLNFSPKDKLNSTALINIARDYLQAIGLEKQPYLVYQHLDAGHPHLHIASVIIDHAGNRLETFDIDIRKPKAIRDALENKYGLTKMGANRIALKHQADDIMPLKFLHLINKIPASPVQLDRVAYGSVETRTAISSIVSQVVKNYTFGSLSAFNAILRQFGVMADRGRPGSHLYKVGGLLYRLLNEHNQPIGTPVKASKIIGRPTLKTLESCYCLHQRQSGPNRQRIRYWLDSALDCGQEKPRPGQNRQSQQTGTDPEAILQKNGIRIVFRESSAGKIMDVIFIDNAASAAFLEEELGERYHAEEILKVLQKQSQQLQQQLPQQLSQVIPPSQSPHHSGSKSQQTAKDSQTPHPAFSPERKNMLLPEREMHNETSPESQIQAKPVENTYPASTLPVIQVIKAYSEDEPSNTEKLAHTKLRKEEEKTKQPQQGLYKEQQQEQQIRQTPNRLFR